MTRRSSGLRPALPQGPWTPAMLALVEARVKVAALEAAGGPARMGELVRALDELIEGCAAEARREV